MSKITKLTKEQEAKIPIYINKWLDIGRSTNSINKEKTVESIKWLYKYGNKEKTPYMWFCDSPLQIQLIINILRNENLLEQNLGSNLESNLGSNLWSNLGSNLRSNLGSNLGSNLRSNLGSNLESNLWSNLRFNLGSNLWSNLESNLESNLGSNNLEYNYYFSPNLQSNWVGFYDYILHELFPEKIKEYKIFSKECREFYTNVYHIIPFENICFISENPIVLYTEEETGFLHNSDGPAMKFKDGYEIYSLFNILIDKEMLTYNADQIMNVKNVEQRLVLIKNYGIENMLDKLDSKKIDTFKEYKLHSILLNGGREKLLEMKNPSEPKTHFEFVPPEIKTCQEAMAWRFGLDLYINPIMKA